MSEATNLLKAQLFNHKEGLPMSQVNEASEVNVLGPISERSMVVPVLLFALAILYDLSPVDIIPDIPVIGYFDDLLITAATTLNLLQKWLQDTSVVLSAALGLMKWLVIFVGIIAVSMVGLMVWGAVKFFAT